MWVVLHIKLKPLLMQNILYLQFYFKYAGFKNTAKIVFNATFNIYFVTVTNRYCNIVFQYSHLLLFILYYKENYAHISLTTPLAYLLLTINVR